MRVLVVTPWFPTAAAPGSGIFNLRDAELLASQHELRVLHLCTPSLLGAGEEEERTAGMTVRRVPYRAGSVRGTLAAARAIKEELRGAELLHSMALPALIPLRLVRVRQPFVHTEHMSMLVTPGGNFVGRAAKHLLTRLLSRPTEAVAVSSALARVIDRVRSRPTTVIPNHVMMPEASVPDEEGQRFAEVRMISVGGMVARKGALEAVGVLGELVDRGFEARLTWVGTGPLRDEMVALAEKLGVRDRLTLPGHQTPDELSQQLQAANLFVLPVETETFGVAMAEALAHGLPVVATGTGGHEEFLPPEASRLVSERAAAPLAAAAVELMRDPKLWSRAEISGYADARFSEALRATAYGEVYRRAVERASSKKP